MSDTKVTLELENYMDCPSHLVEHDPDPTEWFCDDDQKVICTKTRREITCSCRPYNKRKECSIPDWCPLRK